MAGARFTALFAVLFLGVLVTPTHAWWCFGHMVVSTIAQKIMPQEVFNYFNEGIEYNAQHYKNVADMTQQACWLDDLNAFNQERSESWHFLNQCYNPDGTPCPTVSPDIELPKSLALGRDNLLSGTLDAAGKAFWTAELIHTIGDSHQPLHVCQLVSAQFPAGDRGGNLFYINYNGTQLKLHMFYDMIGGEFPNAGNRPFWDYPQSKQQVDSFATYLYNNIAIPANMQTDLNFNDWFAEGLALCAWVYKDGALTPDTTLSEDYVMQARAKLWPRIVTAGYRLANMFTYIYNQTQLKKFAKN